MAGDFKSAVSFSGSALSTKRMMFKDFKKVDSSLEYLNQYWNGPENWFVRIWTYFFNGINVINQGKYLIGLLGLGIFKSDVTFTWQMLALGVIIGTPIIIIVGRWDMFKATKARQFIQGQHGSITQFQNHNMAVVQTALMAEIAIKLGVDVEKVKEDIGIK